MWDRASLMTKYGQSKNRSPGQEIVPGGFIYSDGCRRNRRRRRIFKCWTQRWNVKKYIQLNINLRYFESFYIYLTAEVEPGLNVKIMKPAENMSMFENRRFSGNY